MCRLYYNRVRSYTHLTNTERVIDEEEKIEITLFEIFYLNNKI